MRPVPLRDPVDQSGCVETPSEDALRSRLGVPDGSTEVVVVAESSHWDPNWLLSSQRYYRGCVRPTLDRALDALAAEQRRVFSLECLFFVDLYWRDRPQRRAELITTVNEGRLRFTGSGVTTPDTLLPEDELLLRDLLVGQEWLRTRGMTQEPRLLYLPDSFGHSPGLPALLRAAGFDYAAVCRIDGMRFPGADMESAGNFPRPGTSAARLVSEHTADFVWRAADGSEVLTHWMSHGYGHGDMIASGGLSRVMGLPAAWPDRRTTHIDARVNRYLEDLRPLSRTPYRLLVIGADFVRPVPRLTELLDDWNARNHDRTGTLLVNAGIDDYLDLVSHHREALPTIEFDPNPYWTGFYATRPELKSAARELGRRLVATDARAATSRAQSDSRAIPPSQREQWWVAATSNHHDFVTGTAPNRVARTEQATSMASAIEQTPWPDARPTRAGSTSQHPTGRLTVDHDGPRVVIGAPWGIATFDSTRGGALISLLDTAGTELLARPSLELRAYVDSGGLWRLGNEFHGGRWSLTDRSTAHRATIHVDHDSGVAHLGVRANICGRTASLHHTIRAGQRAIVTRCSLEVPNRRTVTLAVHHRAPTKGVTMHQPGGVVQRPLTRWYEPTFWPLHSFAITLGSDDDALGIATAAPTGLHVDANGSAEVIVARTAVKEIAFGVIPVMAPAWGHAFGRQDAVMAFGWHDPRRPRDAIELGRRLASMADRAVGHEAPHWPVHLDCQDLEIIAVKPADRGEGIIVRLRNWATPPGPGPVKVALHQHLGAEIVEAHLTDSRERDLERLTVTTHRLDVPINGHLTTVRLLTRRRGTD